MAQDFDRTIRLGAAQVSEVYLDREETLAKDLRYIRRAGEKDIDLLVFPEYHLPSGPQWYPHDKDLGFEEYYTRLFKEAVTVPGPTIDRLREEARNAGTAVVIGVTEKESGTAGTMYNSLVFIDADGTLLGVRRKLVPTLFERQFFTGGTGNDITTFNSSLGELSGLMCGEHTNHLAGFSILAMGQDIHAACWPAFPQGASGESGFDQEAREMRVGIRTRFHAFSGGVPVASATGVVNEELAEAIGNPDLVGGGTSSIIAPSGEYLAGPKWDGEGIVHAAVQMDERIRSKATHDVVGHYNRFDVFDLTVNRHSHDPIHFVDGDQRTQDTSGINVTASSRRSSNRHLEETTDSAELVDTDENRGRGSVAGEHQADGER